ncbi:LytR/AlgR family response regulator transcription factor [Larkinella soli]|uniref:LytR/AlgR family response regulator transcription factor n=1 Tax=Larkinella soli TaxID=1770527 RepID=UPI0013E2F2F4|nr:LytTR family DNA-binding domain-containing protein [Larkinella soli]
MHSIIARAVIIDDEYLVRHTLRKMLAEIPEIKVVGEAENVPEGLDLLAAQRPDLIFLDIKMPILSGFDLLDELTRQEQFYGVIFVSGYPDEALAAVQRAAAHLHTDFIVKPIDPEVLEEKVGLFYQKWKAGQEQEAEFQAQLEAAMSQNEADRLSGPASLIFQNSLVFYRIEIADIMYCESANRQINIYCSYQEYLNVPNISLDALERLLPAGQFVRVGKSHILNKYTISSIEKGPRPKCKLIKNGKLREFQLYASNVEKVEQSFSPSL